MQRLLLIVGLVLSLAASGAAAPGTPVQYTLTFNTPEQVIGMNGVIRILTVPGTVGGIAVTGEYTGADWRVGPLVAPEGTLASGPLSCMRSQCTFSITRLLGRPEGVPDTSVRLGRPVTASLPGFATRRAWVAAVSRWAKSTFDPGVRDKIVLQAAGVHAGDGQ